MRRDTLGLLEDIRDAISYIEQDTAGASFADYRQNRQMRQLVERNVVTIGEAVNRIRRHDPATVGRISAHDQIVGLRNVLIHWYAVIQHETVWQAVQTSLPVLRAEVDLLLADTAEAPPQDGSCTR